MLLKKKDISMHKNIFKPIVVIGLWIAFMFSSVAFGGFSDALQIKGIDVGDSNGMHIRFATNTSCGGSLAFVSSSNVYYKDMVAVANLAFATGQPVRVWVGSCDASSTATMVRMVIGTVW